MAESTSRIRVIRAYRSWREGDVLDATPQLARRLIALGVAREETGPRPGRRAATERAVAPMTGEVR